MAGFAGTCDRDVGPREKPRDMRAWRRLDVLHGATRFNYVVRLGMARARCGDQVATRLQKSGRRAETVGSFFADAQNPVFGDAKQKGR